VEIREFLEMPSSRLNADILADKIGEDPQLFDHVWEIMLEEEHPVSMRAAWAITIYGKRFPEKIESRVREIAGILPRTKSASIKRCLLNLLSRTEIPEDLSGRVFDFCFELVESAKSGIAHKAYAMTIMYRISESEPELKPELISLFESQLDDESAGVKARSKILIDKLHRDLQ
jgi:hypothetical protein